MRVNTTKFKRKNSLESYHMIYVGKQNKQPKEVKGRVNCC